MSKFKVGDEVIINDGEYKGKKSQIVMKCDNGNFYLDKPSCYGELKLYCSDQLLTIFDAHEKECNRLGIEALEKISYAYTETANDQIAHDLAQEMLFEFREKLRKEGRL